MSRYGCLTQTDALPDPHNSVACGYRVVPGRLQEIGWTAAGKGLTIDPAQLFAKGINLSNWFNDYSDVAEFGNLLQCFPFHPDQTTRFHLREAACGQHGIV